MNTGLRAVALAFLLSGAAFPAAPAAPGTGMDAARLARIRPRMQEFIEQGEVSGVVTLVQRRGAVVYSDAVGYADIENKKPMRMDTIFQVMSMTKPVTAVGVMILAEEGRLTLLDPVEKFLPEFKDQTVRGENGPRRPLRPVTIRDLMTHTSGMTSELPPEARDLNAKMNMTLADAVRIFARQPLAFQPGERWHYSNFGIATLGRIIEVVSRQPYEKFIGERIFKPLGMKDSFFFPPAEKVGRIAMVYRYNAGKLSLAGPRILGGDCTQYRKGAVYPAPEFGLYSTAPDLTAFYQMMLNGGTYRGAKILSKNGVRVMTSVQTGDLKAGWMPGGGYGLGWEVLREPVGTLTMMSLGTFSHGGAFGTHGWIDKDKSLTGCFMVQREGTANYVRDIMLEMINAAVTD